MSQGFKRSELEFDSSYDLVLRYKIARILTRTPAVNSHYVLIKKRDVFILISQLPEENPSWQQIKASTIQLVGRDSSVSIATRYGLDDLGTESR
jgi:hypothetical protein